MDGPLLILRKKFSARIFKRIDREKAEQYYQQNLRELKG